MNLKGYPALYLHGWPVVLHLRTAPGLADPVLVDAELKFDASADATSLHGELFGPSLGIIVWRDTDGGPHAATMALYNRRYWKQLANVHIGPESRPKHFSIVDRFIGADNDRINWREGIEHLAATGMTAIMLPASRTTRPLLLAAGLKRTAWAVYNPPGYAFDYAKEASSPEKLDTLGAQGGQAVSRCRLHAARYRAVFDVRQAGLVLSRDVSQASVQRGRIGPVPRLH